MKDLKIKGGSFDMAGAAGVAGVIGMLGSAIGKGDGDAATFTKKEKKGVLMSSST
jgi:outer membrane lipoprotein SlyB